MTPQEQAVIDAADKYDRAKTAFDEATAGASSITYKSSDAGAVLLLTHSALREAVRAWRESAITGDEVLEHVETALRERLAKASTLTEADWKRAKAHLDEVIRIYEDLRGGRGVDVAPALTIVLRPLLARFESGERTDDLYRSMIDVE